MKILEVKNNLVKISYSAQDNLVLSGFVIIEDSQCPYVAQVMSLKADSGLNYAIVKLLFTFNEEGVVKNYNGTIPELNASITSLSSDELLDILPVDEPLKIGKLAQQDFILNIDYSALEKNLLICSDKTENTDILLSNIAKQTTERNHKSVIFDTDATINAENKLVFGRDFKLPLNYDTINFIYENDLNDVNPTSKAVIQDIFLEVQEYSKTVLDNFIPFDSFISVVETQYRELNIPELALLKSRLLKYKEENAFAQNAKDFQTLRAAIRANRSTLLDISLADDVLQKQIMSYVYDEINAMDLFVYSLVKINNENADKKLIRKFFAQDKIYTVITAPHSYKYIYELKDRASNMVMFSPQTTQHDFASYNVYLSKLNEDECIVYGKATQNIPLIVEILPIEELNEMSSSLQGEEENNNEDDISAQTAAQDDFSEESDSYSYDTMVNDTAVMEPIKEIQPEPLIDLPTEELPVQDNQEPDIEETQLVEEELIVPDLDENIEEQEEFDNSEDFEKDTFVEEPLEDELADSEILEEPALDDVISDGTEEDSFQDYQSELELDENELEEEQVQDTLTEDDLDYLQKMNMPEDSSQGIYPEQDELIQEVDEEEEEPEPIPVYPAEELDMSNGSIVYEPGDRVTHPKYGDGIVEKMLKYGNKVLCSINFENGRRLLDPSISELQKL